MIIRAALFVQAGVGAIIRLVRDKLRDIKSIKDFGAKGDGVTDDTAAILAAIAAAELAGGWTLRAPAGTYLYTAELPFPRKVNIIGDGIGATVPREFRAKDRDSRFSDPAIRTDSGIAQWESLHADRYWSAVRAAGGRVG